ncbi:putative cell cycle control protein [Erysiphe neolycopersici]|uniref:Putative cell cycle control protein n=1 Tax=Erysiphe neolycopersici TaxID=212602 RepID=A0A420HDV1_9PEZI|nr:putative cell cycle control protein [Erysiphe neolycopersici]
MAEREEPQVYHQHDSLPLPNIIDLTNEVEFEEARRWVPEPQGGPQEPQFLGSNSTIAMENVVDLTGDQEQNDGDEVIFTGQRAVFLRQNVSQSNPRSGPGPVTRPVPRPIVGGSTQNSLPSSSPSLLVTSRSVLPVVPSGYRFRTVRNHGGFAVDLTSFGQIFSTHSMERMPALWQLGALHNMANHLDYGNRSFEQRSHANHMPPPSARDNFTRSPTASDILVCPSCDEELTHNKEDFLGRKSSKVSNKKDREEHPFWVVKECGHVYCNKCYQNRGDKTRMTGFREVIKQSNAKSGTKKALVCAVIDCKCDIKAKDKWVGVFL